MDQGKIGRFLAETRRRRGLTQREMAQRLGVSDKTVSKWERGLGMPELSLMLPVCKLLGMDLNELFSGERLTEADYKEKAEENMMALILEAEKRNRNIVGGAVLGRAETVPTDGEAARAVNTRFWDGEGGELLAPAVLPDWGGFLPSEEKLGLLGNLAGKRVLEIGCGNGRSLQYAAEQGAAELWGLDISPGQIERAREFLAGKGTRAKLVCAPMEEDCGLPEGAFDLVFSVYGIGWSTDLEGTFGRIASYLKRGGVLVFGWSHPIHKCVEVEEGRLVFGNSYFNEEWYCARIGGREIRLANRMLSTYVNALAGSGFAVERLVEETDRERALAEASDFGRKALMVPTAFALRARKLE